MFIQNLNSTNHSIKFIQTSFGWFTLKSTQKGLFYMKPTLQNDYEQSGDEESNKILEDCKIQIQEYFQKKRQQFFLKIDLSVYIQLMKIPYGCTQSYGEIFKLIGNGSPIAVGQACAQNNILIIIPCHRVIGQKGNINGYNEGVQMKINLLDLETSLNIQ